jgi:hypothetical protein
VTAACVRGNRQQYIAVGRNQASPRRQIYVALLANRVLRAVAIRIVVGVLEQRIHSLVALKIDNAHNLALPYFKQEGITGFHHKTAQCVSGQQLTGLQN